MSSEILFSKKQITECIRQNIHAEAQKNEKMQHNTNTDETSHSLFAGLFIFISTGKMRNGTKNGVAVGHWELDGRGGEGVRMDCESGSGNKVKIEIADATIRSWLMDAMTGP